MHHLVSFAFLAITDVKSATTVPNFASNYNIPVLKLHRYSYAITSTTLHLHFRALNFVVLTMHLHCFNIHYNH